MRTTDKLPTLFNHRSLATAPSSQFVDAARLPIITPPVEPTSAFHYAAVMLHGLVGTPAERRGNGRKARNKVQHGNVAHKTRSLSQIAGFWGKGW